MTSFVRKITPRFLEMFEARGYENIEIVDSDAVLFEIKIIGHDPVKNEKVRLLYFETPKFNVRTAEVCVEHVEHAEDLKHIVVVYRHDITCFAKRVLDTYKGALVEHMPAKELEINITRHVLQPKHFIRLSNNAADTFKKKWGTSFPKMRSNDKIARYFNFVKGDVVEVHRTDGDVVYRIVE